MPQARHDEVTRRLDTATANRDAERRNAAELELQVKELEGELGALRERVAERDKALEGEREQLAQLRFEADVIDRERDEAKRTSEQLLIELERIGSHLRSFADDKEGLSRELDQARDRLAALALDEQASQQRFQTARQLTLALAEPLERNTLRLALVDGNIAIQFPVATAFEGEGSRLSPSGKAVLERAATVLTPLDLEVRVGQPNAGTARPERAQAVSEALVSFGLASDRVIAEDGKATVAAEEPASAADVEAVPDDAEAVTEPVARAPTTGSATESDTELELLLRFATSAS